MFEDVNHRMIVFYTSIWATGTPKRMSTTCLFLLKVMRRKSANRSILVVFVASQFAADGPERALRGKASAWFQLEACGHVAEPS